MRIVVVTLSGALVSGCVDGTGGPAPLQRNDLFLTRATEPVYQWRPDGRIGATSCMSGKRSGYGSAPSGCVVDNAFGTQVARKTDMVAPQPPGPAYAAPIAGAAHAYIYGEDGGAAFAAGGDAGTAGQRVPVPPGAPPEDGEAAGGDGAGGGGQ